MAKRRLQDAVNPLKRDLVSSIANPPPTKPREPEPVSAPEPEPQPVEQPQETVKHQAAGQGGGRVMPPVQAETASVRKQRTPTKWTSADTVTMKTRFIPGEAKENAELTEALGLMMDSKVSESHITRALWSLVRRAEDAMQENAGRAPQMSRPPHGDRLALGEYEDAIADFILLALKKTRKDG